MKHSAGNQVSADGSGRLSMRTPRSLSAGCHVLDSVHAGLKLIADLAWPVTCVGCGKWSESAWCRVCSTACEHPGIVRELSSKGFQVFAATVYEGPITHAITAYKDEGRLDSADELVRLLRRASAQALLHAPSGVDNWFVVTVPSRPEAIRHRGFRPLDELAVSIVSGALRWGPKLDVIRHVADQSHLTRSKRALNVTGAFCARGAARLPPHSGILLLDDVVTSGATMEAAFSAMAPLDPWHFVGATIASTPLKLEKVSEQKNLRHKPSGEACGGVNFE